MSAGGGRAVRRPIRGGDIETLDQDILPENAKEIAKEAPQVKSAQWAADEKKKAAAASGTKAIMNTTLNTQPELTSLEALPNDVGSDDANMHKSKREQKSKVEEKKIEEKRTQKLEIKRPADEGISLTMSASASQSSLPATQGKLLSSASTALNAAAPLREGRGLYRQAARAPLRPANAKSLSTSASAKVALSAASSPGKQKDAAITIAAIGDSPSSSSSTSSSHFDLNECIHWLSSHLSEQSWEDELAEDSEKRQAFLTDVEKQWNELDLEGRGYFTAEHLVQLYWAQATGKELDDMPKQIDKHITDKAIQRWKQVQEYVQEDEDEDEDSDDGDGTGTVTGAARAAATESDSGAADSEADSQLVKARAAAAKVNRKRWVRESVTFWKYVNYLLQKADYEQLRVSAPPHAWAKAYFPNR